MLDHLDLLHLERATAKHRRAMRRLRSLSRQTGNRAELDAREQHGRAKRALATARRAGRAACDRRDS